VDGAASFGFDLSKFDIPRAAAVTVFSPDRQEIDSAKVGTPDVS
jgi:hypothetical protein